MKNIFEILQLFENWDRLEGIPLYGGTLFFALKGY